MLQMQLPEEDICSREEIIRMYREIRMILLQNRDRVRMFLFIYLIYLDGG